jgi:nitrate/nitrite transporter NarK
MEQFLSIVPPLGKLRPIARRHNLRQAEGRGTLLPRQCVRSGTAAAAGIALVGSLGHVGGFVGPYLVGLLTDTTGSTTGALLGLAAIALVAAALCLVLRRQAAFASRGLRLPPSPHAMHAR